MYDKKNEIMNIKNFKGTREMLIYASQYIKGKTLDLGAGNAKYKNIIKPKTNKYIACDMFENPNIDIVCDITNLPFAENEFDTIISTQVLEHVEKPWIVVKEIHRTLNREGVCIVSAPFINPFHADSNDYFRYTTEGIKSLFKNEGFEIIEHGSYGKLFSVLQNFILFSFFNPYEKRKLGSWKINYVLTKISNLLNRFTKNKIIYDSVYIIAKKTK